FFTSFSILFSLGILVKILMEQVLLICCAYFSTGSVPTALLRPVSLQPAPRVRKNSKDDLGPNRSRKKKKSRRRKTRLAEYGNGQFKSKVGNESVVLAERSVERRFNRLKAWVE
ncbi:MAG: hypothetical protein M1355_03510, partial [Patescibacteria group bacterium]|nr:hypothetical protein [Patescibacteria group bacterium]